MERREFSAEFRAFIKRYIKSVEQIEVLLILRANPERFWTTAEVSAILRSSVHSIQSRLDGLAARRLANSDAQGYRYAASGRLHEMVSVLEAEYGQRRFSVIEMVFSRADSARSFAEAFRLRGEDEE